MTTITAVPSAEFGDVLAKALWGAQGGVVASTYGPSRTCTVRGWLIAAGWFHPMSSAEVLDAQYMVLDRRWPGPEPGASYEDGPLIPRHRPWQQKGDPAPGCHRMKG